ncbi:LysR family transcriptional regulator [Rhodobacteraceae bacterium LMO-12]|nr:LysR family transcriptional regulator [Rhodobacteraceae bacterium LMO-JJ12]
MITDFPNIRHMRVFLETAKSGSVSVAADACALSQPAATQAIKRLEGDLDAPLLVRRDRKFVTTECGALFLARARVALGHLRSGAKAAERGNASAHAPLDRLVTAAQLRTLIAVAATGSFTVAAKQLGVSQPTVHRAARSLEDAAGTTFFKATPVGVELTPAAQAFVLGAKLALAEIRQGLAEIGRAQGEERSRFVLGSLPLARTAIVPTATHAMVNARPGMQVRIVDGRYDELLRSLREGDLDCMIGAMRDPAPAEDILQEPLFDDALAIVAHPSHPLAARKGVTLEDTLRYPWVAPPKTTPAGQYLYESLRIEQRRQTPVRVVSSSLVMVRGILAEGPYVSIISRHQISVEERDGHIAVLDVALKGNRRAIGLTTRAGWRPTESQAQFIQFLRDAVLREVG